jgi:colanic acid biosynthesis glycosyl transferase WcaI
MRILVSDYSGHPFQVQLSRALAARGHEVRHVFSASFQTPKGRLVMASDDPPGFSIVSVRTDEPFAKHSFVKRQRQEVEIGRKIAKVIAEFAPDVVVSSNAPLDTQRHIITASREAGAKFVFWLQDIYSHAIAKVLSRKLPIIGSLIGWYYQRLEARMIAESDHVVLISPDFAGPVEALAGRNVPATVIENWAPLDEVPIHERGNAWAREHLKPADFRLVYSGTLGFKHNPDLLLALAEGAVGDVCVFSEGEAAEYLKTEAARRGLENLRVSGWLAFDDLPKALSAGDVLLVILEPEAGIYSVPSKTLTYMCIGRPILGAMPEENLAARLIARHGMGGTVSPDDPAGFVELARQMRANASERDAMGSAARNYAERTFALEAITAQFEKVFYSLQIDTRDGV